MGLQPSRSFFLAARYSGWVVLVCEPVMKADWNSASRAWLGVPAGRVPEVSSVV
ncbi:hypothetical protein D3C72_2422800 [compost metagenome]